MSGHSLFESQSSAWQSFETSLSEHEPVFDPNGLTGEWLETAVSVDGLAQVLSGAAEGFGRRWYDQIPRMTTAVHLCRDLPEEIQQAIGKHLGQYIDASREEARKERDVLSVGTERILGLHKSAGKKRWYDQSDRHLARALNQMSVIPQQALSRYAERLIDAAMVIDETKRQRRAYYNPVAVDTAVENILIKQENRQAPIRHSTQAVLSQDRQKPSSARRKKR